MDKQTDRQADKQGGRRTKRKRETHTQSERKIETDTLETEILTNRRANFLTHSQTDGHMERQTYELNTNGPTHRPVAKQADEVSQRDGKLLEWKIRNIKDFIPHLFSPF
jgi:hypothetical protein